MWVGPCFNQITGLIWRDTKELACSPLLSAMWGHSRTASTYHPRRELSPDQPFCPLSLSAQLWENSFLLFNHPVYSTLNGMENSKIFVNCLMISAVIPFTAEAMNPKMLDCGKWRPLMIVKEGWKTSNTPRRAEPSRCKTEIVLKKIHI